MTTQTKTTWQKVKLGDIADLNMGQSPKSEFYNDHGEGLPFFQGITDFGERVPEETMYCSKPAKVVERGDVLISVRAPVGEVNIAQKESCIGRGVAGIRAKDKNNEFLYYLLLNFRDYIRSYSGGTTYESINKDALRDLQFLVPENSTTRQQIAGVLSTYDNLIENNTKRIKILEEIAQAIYKEWFEKNSKIKMQNAKLSEVVIPQYGYTESAQNQPVGPKYLRGMDINKTSYIDWSTVPYCEISNEDKKKYQLEKGDIVVIRMADPGKIGIVEQDIDAVFASYLIRLKIIDDRVSPYYLFYFLISDQYQNYIQGASGGTTRKSASAGVVTGIDIIIPSKEVVDKFEEKISLLRAELNNLLVQNSKLRQARDLLLPKLITGELTISN